MVLINRLYPEVIKICRPLIIEDDVLKLCGKKLGIFLEKSLTLENAHKSTLKCKETYIVDFPDGSERGSAVGLDISGKIFRLVYVTFCGDRVYTVSSRLYEMPEAKLRGSGYKVVEYVARCVANFIETTDIKQDKIPLGVSLGFPMHQESLQEAKLIRWSDDFRCDDFIEEDFFTQLKLALKKHKSTKNVYVIAATTDASSCLVGGLYKDPTTRIGVVLGDQMRVSYLEKQEKITLFPGDGIRTRTAVSVDFNSFGDDGCLEFIKTEFDHQLDNMSEDRGRSTLEKLISGQYMGEVFRLCLVKLIKEKLILGGVLKPKLKTPGAIKSEDIADMEGEDEKHFDRCKVMLKRFDYADPSDDDCCQIRFAARCVTKRSAHLLSTFLASLIAHLEMKEIRISSDGVLSRRFPAYTEYVRKKMRKLRKPGIKFMMTTSEKEDLGIGAGLLAFIYKDGIIKIEDKHRVLPPMRHLGQTIKLDLPCNECSPFKDTVLQQQQ